MSYRTLFIIGALTMVLGLAFVMSPESDDEDDCNAQQMVGYDRILHEQSQWAVLLLGVTYVLHAGVQRRWTRTLALICWSLWVILVFVPVTYYDRGPYLPTLLLYAVVTLVFSLYPMGLARHYLVNRPNYRIKPPHEGNK